MNKKITEIREVLSKNLYFECEICFVRGSYTTNKQRTDSDIDLLIISNDFCGISFWKRRDLVKKAVEEAGKEVDAICLSTDEYQQLLNQKREMIESERMVRII
ncbi:MAG: nucleotidyltransferase domain-containing protein [Clostridia bacterium]|nr:nucleotidyltransferase domain-containing protein [Clostridia bacterium]